jgi:hypothetical protein
LKQIARLPLGPDLQVQQIKSTPKLREAAVSYLSEVLIASPKICRVGPVASRGTDQGETLKKLCARDPVSGYK